MLFVIKILEQRSRFEHSGFLWRIRLKVARHMYGVLVRRAGMTSVESLPELSTAEQDELIETHWMLRLDSPRPVPVGSDAAWRRALNSKVARFTNRMRSRRTDRET